MDVTIPGALADHLSRANLTTGPAAKHRAAADLRIALNNARRGRGRTLVIPAHGTGVLHLISAFAEAILENRKLHTTAEVRAARLWIQRAGHNPEPAPQAAEPPHRGNLADTVACPACHVGVGAPCITRAGKPAREIHSRRVEALENAAGVTQHRAEQKRANGGLAYGINHAAESELFAAYAARINPPAQAPAVIRDKQEQQRAAETRLDLAEEQAADAFDAAAHAVEAVEYAEQVEASVATVEDAEALYAAQLITEAEATDGTWRGEWIGEQPDALFPAHPDREQGSLFA
ncbi:hypothetical protein ACFUGD_06585 [Streptomyces sp. NPDC057217]|uniref:zinc finger domain-containing protein n=1 Tax=Streptomyces sp. NPDC057217 TaxID=3346054 RepID=UPI003635FA92